MPMKRIAFITLAFILTCTVLYSQDTDFYFGGTDFEIKTTKSKEDIWLSSKIWIAENTRFPKIATKMEDERSGILIVRYDFPTIESDLEFISLTPSVTMRINVSDSLCTVRITDAVCHVDKSQELEKLLIEGGSMPRLKKAQKQIEWLKDLSVNEFNSTTDWSIREDYTAIRDKYKATDDHTEKKRDKECREGKYSILQGALTAYIVPVTIMIDSFRTSIK